MNIGKYRYIWHQNAHRTCKLSPLAAQQEPAGAQWNKEKSYKGRGVGGGREKYDCGKNRQRYPPA